MLVTISKNVFQQALAGYDYKEHKSDNNGRVAFGKTCKIPM